ncbi:MAG: oxidoreductase [Xanthobacteraceae bacterium]|nr:oxidoreductase [Xanthobacteraceae bacterium]
MNPLSERSKSLWTLGAVAFPRLEGDETADVVVVGAGIVGLSTAYELVRDGQDVVVLDRGAVGGGMTHRSTAHLSTTFDNLYIKLIELRGLPIAQAYRASQAAGLARMAEICQLENIDCDFKFIAGYLSSTPDDEADLLDRELAAATAAGMPGVHFVQGAPLGENENSRTLCFPDEARLHPGKYTAGLAQAIVRHGGRIYADSPVMTVDEVDGAVRVTTQHGHTVRANAAVIASNVPVDNDTGLDGRQSPVRTFVAAGPVPKGSVEDALHWDTAQPYHYVRLQPGEDFDWLIYGGEDHRPGEADDAEARFARLERWVRDRFPMLGKVSYRWSGQIMEPFDHCGLIGRSGGTRIFVATGDSGHGMTTAAAASLILRDLVAGRENVWSEVYDPARFTPAATDALLRETRFVTGHLMERIREGDVDTLAEVRPGQGALIRLGGTKVAAYRSPDGELSLHSAVCTHRGGIVHWNSFERCWDCPCHGSHFATDGSVLHGPATEPLPKFDLPYETAPPSASLEADPRLDADERIAEPGEL